MDPVIDVTLRMALALLFFVARATSCRTSAASGDARRVSPPAREARAARRGPRGRGGGAAAGALLVPGARAAGLLSAATLLVVYGAAVAINLARGRRHIDCGCAGPAGRRPISGALVARNAALAALALAGLVPVHPRALLWVDGLTVAGATAALAAFYARLDRMIVFAPGLARLRGDA